MEDQFNSEMGKIEVSLLLISVEDTQIDNLNYLFVTNFNKLVVADISVNLLKKLFNKNSLPFFFDQCDFWI
jgi:hypothetical protein